MTPQEFRIESNYPIASRLLPMSGSQQYLVSDRALAVAVAAKSTTRAGAEIRVVHVPTGEVVFRKRPAARPLSQDDL
ncbi:MAG TPA: hypothetical protein VEA35_04585 [Ramlibacter sp.]|nr:hypothetical protein [Ramlibacter sp.]